MAISSRCSGRARGATDTARIVKNGGDRISAVSFWPVAADTAQTCNAWRLFLVTLSLSILAALAGLVIVAGLSWRDHIAERAVRRTLLDDCSPLLDQSGVQHGGDDFPRLDGVHLGQRVRAELIADTMTIRRLPQLWLSLTRLEARPGLPEFAILVRPAGTEFYSLTANYDHRLDAPAGLPSEILVRGSGPAAQALLARTGDVISRILANEKIKEVAVTAKGLRLVWQASEGRRGEHLLLRQAMFDNARVPPERFTALLADLDDLSRAIGTTWETRQR